jgi:two-component system, cell cycle sensor histidine kinase and response regulator CckA
MSIENNPSSSRKAVEVPHAVSHSAKSPDRGSETILVVEDHDPIRRMMVRCLENHGYKVLSAVNGKDALQVFQSYSEPINMLLSDVIMPEMDGVKLAETLKPLAPHMKILFISGYTDDWNRYFNPEHGDKHLFQKPFTIPEFLLEVRKCLDRDS